MAIKTKGDPLYEPIHWKGRQWAVTAFGLQALDGKYTIAKARLWDDNDGHGWEDQMADKDEVDQDDFREGLRRAREVHSKMLKLPAR